MEYKIRALPRKFNYALDDYLNEKLAQGYKLIRIVVNIAVFKKIDYKDEGKYIVTNDFLAKDDQNKKIFNNMYLKLYYTKTDRVSSLDYSEVTKKNILQNVLGTVINIYLLYTLSSLHFNKYMLIFLGIFLFMGLIQLIVNTVKLYRDYTKALFRKPLEKKLIKFNNNILIIKVILYIMLLISFLITDPTMALFLIILPIIAIIGFFVYQRFQPTFVQKIILSVLFFIVIWFAVSFFVNYSLRF